MNNDIKEILKGIEVVIKHDGTLEFDAKELKVLLNYITNLQEENEHLITQLNTYENTIKEVNKECNSLFNHLTKKDLDYKSRNEKALYFIDMDKHISTNWDNLTNKEKDEFILSLLIELENILQGENKE